MNEPEAITVDRREWFRLRAIVARVEDVEALARTLYLGTEGLDSDMGRWAATYNDLEDCGKKRWLTVARAMRDYMIGGRG